MKRAGLIVFIVANLLAESSHTAEQKAPALPENLRPQAEEARKAFASGDYREAARIYEVIQTNVPDNLWVLSNLAVVQIRQDQKERAEKTLRAALAVAPEDGFCRRMLGIVYYSQQKYDDSITELTKALEIDPKDAEAQLFLSFCAAQKGWTEKAEKGFNRAVKLEPNYKFESIKAADAERRWPVGDYLTPLERSRLRLPPPRVVR